MIFFSFPFLLSKKTLELKSILYAFGQIVSVLRARTLFGNIKSGENSCPISGICALSMSGFNFVFKKWVGSVMPRAKGTRFQKTGA